MWIGPAWASPLGKRGARCGRSRPAAHLGHGMFLPYPLSHDIRVGHVVCTKFAITSGSMLCIVKLLYEKVPEG